MSQLKQLVRNTLIFFHLDVTKNLAYDRLTMRFLKDNLFSDANVLDVGCHKGEILDEVIKLAPKGNHCGFEPIPSFYQNLENKYKNHTNIQIINCALSDEEGSSTFQFVKNAPAYSGLKRRDYDTSNPEIEEIKVAKKRIDDLDFESIHLIKIDVEGGEYHVLSGGKELIKRDRPKLIFEFGKAGAAHYQVTPEMLASFLDELSYELFELCDYYRTRTPLSLESLKDVYESNKGYYFVAIPQ